MNPRHARAALILFAIWTVPVALGTAGHYFGEMMEGPGMPRSHIIAHSVTIWYVWIPATPLMLWIWRRFPFERRTMFPGLALHFAVVLAVFVAQTWLSLQVGHATGHVPPQVSTGAFFTGAVVNVLLYDMLIYAFVIAVAAGLEYAQRYRDRDLRASQLETQLERARLETLRMQLQPHFLFNALNAIAMLVRRDRKQEAVDVVVGFSELLRYVLDESGTMDVTLGEELRFVRRYLEIEGVRLADRLAVHFDVEPGVEKEMIPNLLLQPLVENALKHGIVTRALGGSVWVRALQRGGRLRLEVADDGPGITAGEAREPTGIGLRNLRERLEIFYGGDASFWIGAREGGGTLAVLELPLESAVSAATASRTAVSA